MTPATTRVWRLSARFATGGTVAARVIAAGPDAPVSGLVWLGDPDDVSLVRLAAADLARHRGRLVTVRTIAAATTEIGGTTGVSDDVVAVVRGVVG